jgi:uncharacterized protein YndB with AHSA1/START domain
MATQKFGRLTQEKDGYQVSFERILTHSVMEVWDAITNPEKMKLWFMEVEMELKPGARMIIRFGDKDNTESYGTILRVEPGKLFEYIWENTDGPDELAVWELFPEGSSKCRLVMTYSRLDEKYKKSVPAGWHTMLDHLEEVLNGRQEPWPFTEGETEEQTMLQKKYSELLNE